MVFLVRLQLIFVVLIVNRLDRLMVMRRGNGLMVLLLLVMMLVVVVQHLVMLVIGVVLQHQSVAVVFLGFRMHLL